MNRQRRLLVAVGPLGLLLASGCAPLLVQPNAEARASLAPNGRLRVGFFPDSPTRPLIQELGKSLAERLGATYEPIELKGQAEQLAAVRDGQVDFSGTNASAARAAQMDFAGTVIDIELGFMAVPGGRVKSASDVDKAGIRVGVTERSTSQTILPKLLKNAAVVPVGSARLVGEMLLDRRIDAFATNKSILSNMLPSIPEAFILEGNWGAEHWALCIPKGRDKGMAYLRAFTEAVRAEGLVKNIVERAGIVGVIGL